MSDVNTLELAGFLLIDKPDGLTSHDVIDALRRTTGIRTIGHAGTLDPFATGLLLCAVGRKATKHLSRFIGMSKEYVAEAYLGAIADTYDREGKITVTSQVIAPEKKTIECMLRGFVGEQEQLPPAYSAKKVHGKKMYELARKGCIIERTPNRITIFAISPATYDYPHLSFSCHVSTGTYIRTLIHDIGHRLGCGAYAQTLRRTTIGSFNVTESVTLDKLTPKNWMAYLKTYEEIQHRVTQQHL